MGVKKKGTRTGSAGSQTSHNHNNQSQSQQQTPTSSAQTTSPANHSPQAAISPNSPHSTFPSPAQLSQSETAKGQPGIGAQSHSSKTPPSLAPTPTNASKGFGDPIAGAVSTSPTHAKRLESLLGVTSGEHNSYLVEEPHFPQPITPHNHKSNSIQSPSCRVPSTLPDDDLDARNMHQEHMATQQQRQKIPMVLESPKNHTQTHNPTDGSPTSQNSTNDVGDDSNGGFGTTTTSKGSVDQRDGQPLAKGLANNGPYPSQPQQLQNPQDVKEILSNNRSPIATTDESQGTSPNQTPPQSKVDPTTTTTNNNDQDECKIDIATARNTGLNVPEVLNNNTGDKVMGDGKTMIDVKMSHSSPSTTTTTKPSSPSPSQQPQSETAQPVNRSKSSSRSPSHTDNQTFSLLLIGDEGCGKSALLRRFFQNTFTPQYLPTIGIDFLTSTFVQPEENGEVNGDGGQQNGTNGAGNGGNVINLLMYDTSGSKKFQSLIPNYLRECSVCLLCFDLSNLDSYRAIFDVYLPTIHARFGDNVILIAVGCKNDLTRQRVVSYEDIKIRTKELSIPYLETSARTGFNVSLLFNQIAKILPEISSQQKSTPPPSSTSPSHPQQPNHSATMSRDGNNDDGEALEDATERDQSCFASWKCW